MPAPEPGWASTAQHRTASGCRGLTQVVDLIWNFTRGPDSAALSGSHRVTKWSAVVVQRSSGTSVHSRSLLLTASLTCTHPAAVSIARTRHEPTRAVPDATMRAS